VSRIALIFLSQRQDVAKRKNEAGIRGVNMTNDSCEELPESKRGFKATLSRQPMWVQPVVPAGEAFLIAMSVATAQVHAFSA
jgi:hypothetical protein